jgi:hypothetical protein
VPEKCQAKLQRQQHENLKSDIKIYKTMAKIYSFTETQNGNHLMLEKFNSQRALFREVSEKNLTNGRFYIVKTEKSPGDKYNPPETVLPDDWQSAGIWLECKEKKIALQEFEKMCDES